jgi:hypothetical protein
LLTRINPANTAGAAAAKPRRWRAAPGGIAHGVRTALGLSLPGIVFALWSLLAPQPAQAAPSAEYEIKAAFMYNFAKFVQWPAGAFGQPQSPLSLCVIGHDDFGGALDTIDHKLAQQHELLVRRKVHLEDARSCHILFVAQSEHAHLTSILRAVAGASVLTVSDIDRFAEAGGVIGFYDLDNKLQFSINPEQARSCSLQINAQLLKLARIVRSDAREDGQ